VLGTAAYLAPEQAHGEPAGPPADLYALGVVTYQFLAGRLPYEAQSLTELAFKQQQEVPPALDLINSEVTPQLAVAVQRAMALDPRDRYASAEDMRTALVDGVRGIGPTTAVTRMADPATAATTVHARDREPTAATRAPSGSVEPRRAREPPRARAAAAAAAAPAAPAPAPARDRARRTQQPARGRGPTARPPRRRHRVRRFFGVVFLLLLFAAGGAAAIIATSNDSDAVHLRQVVYDNVNQSVDALKQLVQDNTQ
jgi:serine/threonine-protein kinase